MRNPIQKTKITQLKTSRGIERKMALEKVEAMHYLCIIVQNFPQ